ncbi:MAG TPA: hypothetical protein VFU47_01555 [Armatimonadota bacterium]|nr:hypothetical protein [Armatimonadota bacterium]
MPQELGPAVGDLITALHQCARGQVITLSRELELTVEGQPVELLYTVRRPEPETGLNPPLADGSGSLEPVGINPVGPG